MKAPEEDRRARGEAADTGVRFVYGFDEDPGTEEALALCGGKGTGLMRMRSLGLPVPEGFVITTEACNLYTSTGELPEGLM
ncbi:MAG: PEP/pyruvate-binding domain-containing protein, partial [Actinomycetota bacterium]